MGAGCLELEVEVGGGDAGFELEFALLLDLAVDRKEGGDVPLLTRAVGELCGELGLTVDIDERGAGEDADRGEVFDVLGRVFEGVDGGLDLQGAAVFFQLRPEWRIALLPADALAVGEEVDAVAGERGALQLEEGVLEGAGEIRLLLPGLQPVDGFLEELPVVGEGV